MTDPRDIDREFELDLDRQFDLEVDAGPPDPAIERLLIDTFDHRAVRLGSGRPDLDGVVARVRRRRRQRRTVAALGSVVVLGGGVVGLTQLADSVGGDVSDQLSGAVGVADGDGVIWSCTGLIRIDASGAQEFDQCTQITTGDPVPLTTAPMVAVQPGTLPAPATTMAPMVSTTTTIPAIDVREVVVISPTEQQYTVVAGDSLFAIGRLFDVDMETLANYNAWENGLEHTLLPGDVVLIPPDARVPVGEGQGGIYVYTVQPGDTATAIARRFGVSLAELTDVNGWTPEAADQIQAGDEIVIPGTSPVLNS